MVYEMRVYTLQPGKVAAFQELIRSCQSWGCLIENKSPRWPGARHLTATVETCAAAVVFGADAHRCGASCIWRRLREFAAIPPSELSISGCVPMVSTPSPRSSPACVSSSSFSTPCSTTKLPGILLRSLPLPQPFLPSRARIFNTVAARAKVRV